MTERLRALVLCLGALVMGVLVGSITTVVHQNTVDVGSFEFPWGLILGLIAVTGFLVGLRMVVQNRWVVLCAALGMVAMVYLYSLKSPGGSVFIPNNLWGQIWAVGPALIATIVLLWPRLNLKPATPKSSRSES